MNPPILSLHEPIHKKLLHFYNTKRIPHIIFHGSSGSGKHTLVYQFLQMIYGGLETHVDSNILFVNCAHGKGIRFIREELKFFAMTNVDFGKSKERSNITFKTIVLTNADHLTVDAQSAMRRCIEQYSHNTRFFILVENKNKLLTPILSRFCEIYVPDYIHEKKNNLHQYQLDFYFPNRNLLQEQKQIQLEKILEPIFLLKKEKHNELIKITNELYEKGYHGKDIVDWLVSSSCFTPMEKSNIQICYYKIKSEFRCEKLLMLYLFDFSFYSPLKDVSTISFM